MVKKRYTLYTLPAPTGRIFYPVQQPVVPAPRAVKPHTFELPKVRENVK